MPKDMTRAAAFTIPSISLGETNISSVSLRLNLAFSSESASGGVSPRINTSALITVGTPMAITGMPRFFWDIAERVLPIPLPGNIPVSDN